MATYRKEKVRILDDFDADQVYKVLGAQTVAAAPAANDVNTPKWACITTIESLGRDASCHGHMDLDIWKSSVVQ